MRIKGVRLQNGQSTGLRAPRSFHADARSLGQLLAISCVGAYVLRASLVGYAVNTTITEFLSLFALLSIIVSGVYVSLGGIGRINRWGLLLIAITGVSLLDCERFYFSSTRWVGWVIMMWAIGPIACTQHACRFRRHMLRGLSIAFVMITLISAIWWLAGIPNLGHGNFTGVMWHSLLLGPIAAYVAILALSRWLTLGSSQWLVLYGLSAVVVLLSSSRAALASMAFGTFVVTALRIKKQFAFSALVMVAVLLLVAMPSTVLGLLGQILPGELTTGLAAKSWNHSRELHWEARWNEFTSSPLTGVGFVSAWEGTVGVDGESGAVETGSSYLAILSMTGYLGAIACALLSASLAMRLAFCWRKLADVIRLEFCGLAGFWAVHLGAEGYIYAVGSILALTFWLWMGCLNDFLNEAEVARQRSVPIAFAAAPRLDRTAQLMMR
jgi:hypothetical protein